MRAVPNQITEGQTATFIVTRSNVDPFFALQVNYSMGGRATEGSDYTLSGPSGHAVIPAGQSSVNIILTSVADHVNEGKESAKLILAPGTGYTINRTHSSASVNLKKGP